MDILNKIIADTGSLNDLLDVLALNRLTLAQVYAAPESEAPALVYPKTLTPPVVFVRERVDATVKKVRVGAYQSVLDVCVQQYGSLDNLSVLLEDNHLAVNDYLNPGAQLVVRVDATRNKISNTLFAQNATVSNYDRIVPANTDIYLGTEDGEFIGPTTNVKIKVN